MRVEENLKNFSSSPPSFVVGLNPSVLLQLVSIFFKMVITKKNIFYNGHDVLHLVVLSTWT